MSQSGGSSFPIGKVLIGCGCLSLLIGGVIVAVVVAGGFWAVNEVKQSEVGQLIEEMDDQVELAKTKEGQKKLADKAKKKGMSELDDLEPGEMLDWPAQPLTKKDVDAHVAFMDAWQNSKAYKEASKNRDTVEELGKKKDSERGAIDNLRAINAMKNLGVNSVEANETMERLAQKHGGMKNVMRRYFQILAVSGAASGIAGNKAKLDELVTDEVADKMKSEHAEWQKKYTTWSKVNKEYYRVMFSSQSDPELLERLSKDPDFKQSSEDQKELNKVQSKTPGLLVLGKLPPKTIDTWKALDVDERKALVDKYAQLPILSLFAFIPSQKYDAHTMAKQILAMEYARLTAEVAQSVEAEQKKNEK